MSVSKTCALLCLIPIQASEDGKKFHLAPVWKRIVHVVLVLFYVSLAAYRFGVTFRLWAEEGLNTSTVMCSCYFLVVFLGICFAVGSTWKTLELKLLLNSWEPTLRSIQKIGGERIDIFRNTKYSFEIVAVTCGPLVAGVDATAFSLVLDNLPVSVFSTVRRLGMIPEPPLQSAAWKIGLFPLELVISLAPMCVVAFNVQVIMLGQVVLQLYGDNLRLVLYAQFQFLPDYVK